MELDLLWERLFSEDGVAVDTAWKGLDRDEQRAVREMLQTISTDGERIEEQRRAARFALTIVEATNVEGLPEGALAFARELAHRVGARLRENEGLLIASLKQDGTLVTEYDLEADRTIAREIRARYPDHGILSEEQSHLFGSERWTWVIDPIDGTSNFTWGFPTWGVLIALLLDGFPVMGVADFPMMGHQFYGVDLPNQRGAWLNEAPIRAAHETALAQTQLYSACSRTLRYGRPNLPGKVRISGSTGFDLAMLARGSVIGVIQQSVHVWDVAAMWPIVRAAGATVSPSLSEALFPLIPGMDYGDAGFAILGACTVGMEAALKERLADRFSATQSLRQAPGTTQ